MNKTAHPKKTLAKFITAVREKKDMSSETLQLVDKKLNEALKLVEDLKELKKKLLK